MEETLQIISTAKTKHVRPMMIAISWKNARLRKVQQLAIAQFELGLG